MNYSLDDVRLAWNEYNHQMPCIQGEKHQRFVNREKAWKHYCWVRDHYLCRIGALSKYELSNRHEPNKVNLEENIELN